jgi:hypothetical protein
MGTLAIFAVAVGIANFGLWTRVRFRPPDAATPAIASLKRGLGLGIFSSISVALLCALMLHYPLVQPSKASPFVIFALSGNILNLTAGIYCLRELNGESLLAGMLLLFNQILWILYALRVILVDF